MDPTIDPAFLRGLTQRRLSRRDLIRYAGVGAGALSLSSILAACAAKSSGAAGSESAAAFDWASQTLHHQLNFANWPYYIDVDHGTHPTLDTFTQKTGIQVNYKPVINDNQAFYAKLKPSLEQGKPTGWDIVVITNGAQLSELIDNGWLIPLDLSQLPNFTANASPTIWRRTASAISLRPCPTLQNHNPAVASRYRFPSASQMCDPRPRTIERPPPVSTAAMSANPCQKLVMPEMFPGWGPEGVHGRRSHYGLAFG